MTGAISYFHTFTKGLKKPFDEIFIKTMQRTTQALCEHIQGCKIGYVESDEISLLLTDYDTLTTAAWFDYSGQKVCSVSAAMATMYFNRFFEEEVDKWDFANIENKECVPEKEQLYFQYLISRINLGGYFDARAFNIPETEIVNYFIWRQNDATRNSIQGLAHANFSQKSIQSLNNSQIQDKLHEEKGINWNDCSTVEKRGTCIIKQDVTEDVDTPSGIMPITRSKWVIDNDIPIFTKDRQYIENNIKIKEVSE